MHYYELYGLKIKTTILFPEADEITCPDIIDATIQFKEPPSWVMAEYHSGKFSSLKTDEMWFRLNDEMIIYVVNGQEAYIHLITKQISELRIRSYILTGALTFLLMQRDYLLIHGSALVYQNEAYIISGASGAGKSTTALSLLQKDNIFFASDDICAIRYQNGESILYPGPPWQKLCKNVKNSNPGYDYTFLDEVGEKYAHKITDKAYHFPVPVKAMFILDCESQDLQMGELFGITKMTYLTNNLFRGEILNILGITPNRMQLFASVAASYSIYSISRAKNLDTSKQICDYIQTTIHYT